MKHAIYVIKFFINIIKYIRELFCVQRFFIPCFSITRIMFFRLLFRTRINKFIIGMKNIIFILFTSYFLLLHFLPCSTSLTSFLFTCYFALLHFSPVPRASRLPFLPVISLCYIFFPVPRASRLPFFPVISLCYIFLPVIRASRLPYLPVISLCYIFFPVPRGSRLPFCCRFRTCLKSSNTGASNLVGRVFFDMVRTECFMFVKKKVCHRWDWWGKCKKYGVEKRAVLREPLPWFR